MPFFQLSGAGSTCMFPIFGAWPSPTGELRFLPPRASQAPPDTKKQRHASRWGNASGTESWTTALPSSMQKTQTGQRLISHRLYGRLEKPREKGNELSHLMTRKKHILGRYSHWDGLIYASGSASSKWFGPNIPHGTLFSEYGLRFSPHFLFPSLSSFLPTGGKKKRSFWISGKFWYFHLGWDPGFKNILLFLSLYCCSLDPACHLFLGNIPKKDPLGVLSSAAAVLTPAGCTQAGHPRFPSSPLLLVMKGPVSLTGTLWKSAGELSPKNGDVLFILGG